MKRITLTILALLLAITCAFGIVGCDTNDTPPAEMPEEGEQLEAAGLWENATYRSNTTIGEGNKTISFTVEAEGKMINVTLKTDKSILGDAMYEHKLINDPSFFNVLNGIEASWEKDQAYWAFYEGDTLKPYGVNDQKINGGERYRFVYTK